MRAVATAMSVSPKRALLLIERVVNWAFSKQTENVCSNHVNLLKEGKSQSSTKPNSILEKKMVDEIEKHEK
jgi:hypothetical protein